MPGRPKTIAYTEIQSVEMIDLALFTGSYRLVGISLGRPTTYFHWDRNRRGKTHGLRLDLGRRLKVAITPDDPERVLALLKSRTG